jgi:hypothetical protein
MYWGCWIMGNGRERVKVGKGLNWLKQSILTVEIHWETPLNNHFGINSERQDYKIRSVCGEGYLWKGGGWMEEIKVREYGWWASYTHVK